MGLLVSPPLPCLPPIYPRFPDPGRFSGFADLYEQKENT